MGPSIPMEILITKPEHSLVFQSRDASFHPGCLDKRNIRVNCDGVGVAWYNPKKIDEGGCLVKFPTPAWSSPNLLNIAKFVESGLVFAHVRAAFDGAALTGNVTHENTHPFKNKRYTFMHNGGIPGFCRMKRKLLSLLGDEAYQAIEGTTDSEVCFAYFLDELPDRDAQLSAAEIAQVLRRTISRLVAAVARFSQQQQKQQNPQQATCSHATTAPSSEPRGAPTTKEALSEEGTGEYVPCSSSSSSSSSLPQAVPPMSLNFCVTDGRHIVCSRYRNHPRQDPPSLFLLAGAGVACDKEGSCLRLCGEEPRTSVVISSEPLCRSTKSWKLVPRNSMVIVEGSRDRADVSPGDWDHSFPVQQGLVSSIKFEPLRCHPSDAPPDSNGYAHRDPAPLPPTSQQQPSSAQVGLGIDAKGGADECNGNGVSGRIGCPV